MDLLFAKSVDKTETETAVAATMRTHTRVEEEIIFKVSLQRFSVDSLQDQVYM